MVVVVVRWDEDAVRCTVPQTSHLEYLTACSTVPSWIDGAVEIPWLEGQAQ